MTMATEWRYAQHQGANDGLAPHRGGYWIADFAEQDMLGFVWHDDEADTWRYRVILADEAAYNGTPETEDTAAKRDEAQAAVDTFMEIFK